ncbi:MAG: hypothetical protein GY696_19445 [Gammaproteobacteria bacterium]|nr:hypothetical protein [Gammaproteobacteria bacterium]
MLQEPSDVHGVRQFLGTCNWYSKFIPQYADLTEPLLHLTRKDVSFQWTQACQSAFSSLKQQIVSPQVLVPMNPNLPFILTTDASNVGLGAHLDQMHDGQQRTIAFASKTLSYA